MIFLRQKFMNTTVGFRCERYDSYHMRKKNNIENCKKNNSSHWRRQGMPAGPDRPSNPGPSRPANPGPNNVNFKIIHVGRNIIVFSSKRVFLR